MSWKDGTSRLVQMKDETSPIDCPSSSRLLTVDGPFWLPPNVSRRWRKGNGSGDHKDKNVANVAHQLILAAIG